MNIKITVEYIGTRYAGWQKQSGVKTVQSEIEAAITATGDPQIIEQMRDPMEKLYIRNVLQKNKLITKLIEEVQGVHGGPVDHAGQPSGQHL